VRSTHRMARRRTRDSHAKRAATDLCTRATARFAALAAPRTLGKTTTPRWSRNKYFRPTGAPIPFLEDHFFPRSRSKNSPIAFRISALIGTIVRREIVRNSFRWATLRKMLPFLSFMSVEIVSSEVMEVILSLMSSYSYT